MIIHTIALHNFMSYADAKLDLTAVDVACLTGNNGAGKSAILDAITWAIWESARSSSDELVRLGEREMWVEILFDWEGETYSIRRSRYRGTSKGPGKMASKGTLEFKVSNGHHAEHVDGGNGNGNGKWLVLTANGMRETQSAINKLLRMDYDTFVNSVYLRQGKADEFTLKPPSDRKDVLSEILGLGYFDELQERAREKARALKSDMEFLEHCLTGLPGLTEELSQAQKQKETLSSQSANASQKLDACRQKVAELEASIAELRVLEAKAESESQHLSDLASDIDDIAERIAESHDKLNQLQLLLDDAETIEAEWQRLNQTKEKLAELDNLGTCHQDLVMNRQNLNAELMRQRMKLELEVDNSEKQLADVIARQEKLAKDTAQKEKLEIQYAEFKKLILEEAELEKRQEEHGQVSLRVEDLKAKLTESSIRLTTELELKENSIVELKALLDSGERLKSEKEELEKEAERLEKLEAEFSLVEERGLKLKEAVEKAEQKIGEFKRLMLANESKIKELSEHRDGSCPLCSSPIVDRMAVIECYREEIQEYNRSINEEKDTISTFDDERAALRRKYVELRNELDLRKELDIRIGQYNERLNSVERARMAIGDLEAQVEKLKLIIANNDFAHVERESLVAMRLKLTELDFDPAVFANLQAQIRAKRQVEFRFHQMERDVAELDKLQESLPLQEAKTKELKRELEGETFGGEIRTQVTDIEKQIAELGYDASEHKKWRGDLQNLAPVQEKYRAMVAAKEECPKLEKQISELKSQHEAKVAQRDKTNVNLALWQKELKSMPSLSAQLEEWKGQENSWQTQLSELEKQIAVLEARSDQLLTNKQDLEEKEKGLSEKKEELADFQYLAEAFGKKGLQAVIIENAVPEIENEANKILSRLSDHKMHLGLITQQETRSGKLVETLDLVVADDVGTRNYELYSGGEAFKVDFAVRVALSRLLARRAGAKLQTLVIDEGFGSQDTGSRERLVQAISSVKNDFARILVITHISEVKDMFPIEIQVAKRNGTSHLQVVG